MITILLRFSFIFLFLLFYLEANEPKAEIPSEGAEEVDIVKEEEEENEDISSSRWTWEKHRNIQSRFSPEFGYDLQYRDLSSEEGFVHKFKLRYFIRGPLSFSVIGDQQLYKNVADSSRSENLSALQVRLFYEKLYERLYSSFETGHHGRLGGEIGWDKSLKPGASFGLNFKRRSVKESLSSLNVSEVEDRARFGVFMQLPTNLFISSESSIFYNYLKSRGDVWGKGQQYLINVGFDLVSKAGNEIGWEFYDESMQYGGTLKQYVRFSFTQDWNRFSAGGDYLRILDRTRESATSTLSTSMGLPLTQHFGIDVRASIGQDLERGLRFAKIRRFNALTKWVPTHRSRIDLKAEYSTENTGIIKGDIFQISASWHLNL